jgi:aquaporin TIP
MNMIRAVRRRFTIGHLATAKDPATLRHAAAELLATAIFVFAAEGATLSLGTYVPTYVIYILCIN